MKIFAIQQTYSEYFISYYSPENFKLRADPDHALWFKTEPEALKILARLESQPHTRGQFQIVEVLS